MKDADEFYKPEIKQKVLIDGIAGETIAKGSTGKIIQKGFLTSVQTNFASIANNLTSIFYSYNSKDLVNSSLIIIKKDNTAKLYSKFPLSMLMRAKKDIKKGTLVNREDIFDIAKLEFKDSVYEINIEADDKIIFIFRMDWKFGIFFDFTKKMIRKN